MAIKISGTTVIDDDRNINVGIITANEFVGSGDKLIFSPQIVSTSPGIGTTSVLLTSNIVITYDQLLVAGEGDITLREVSGIGTVIETIGIGSTSAVISDKTLTIFPTSSLPQGTTIYVGLPTGLLTNYVGGDTKEVTNYTFDTIEFRLDSIAPSIGATGVGIGTSISLTFSSEPVTKGTGIIELKDGSPTGTLIESFDIATSPQVTVVGTVVNIQPSSNLPFITEVHTVIPDDAIVGYTGINTVGTAYTHFFTTAPLSLGDAYEGGYLICQSGGTRWIVSPYAAEVVRSWGARADSNTRAQEVSGCTGWFVPNISQAENPGYVCRAYWDQITWSPSTYWVNTQINAEKACTIQFGGGFKDCANAGEQKMIRSFRTVSY